MLNASDIPHPIIINEAVDITKYYSSTQSSRFVNGVLDRFSKSLLEKQSAPESK
jgi:N utilization substance protein B